MESILLPDDPETLLALADEIADFLAENRTELSVSAADEARLKAGIAAFTYARSAYVAMLAGAGESPPAARFLGPVRVASDKAELQLRRRLTLLMAEFAVLANDCPYVNP